MLKNFRSKYVGETEGNLERVLSVLRAMGPVVVVVDEADAALGSREQDGDSGTSSRVFAMIAAQMGDTRYRGQIIWMLLTARPDLLPIDLKRQGRAEVHIPLFYPTDEDEIRQMFVILGEEARVDAVAPRTCRRFRSAGTCRAPTSRAWSAARWRTSLLAGARSRDARGARRGRRAVHAVDAGARARAAGDGGDPRVHRPSVPAAGDPAEDGRRRAAARALQARLTALKQLVKDCRPFHASSAGFSRTVIRLQEVPVAPISSWFDEKAEHAAIQERVSKLESFTSALADGVVSKTGARRPGAAAAGRDEGARGSAERRPARQGDDRARRADGLQRHAAAARAPGRARPHGVREGLRSRRLPIGDCRLTDCRLAIDGSRIADWAPTESV